MKKIWGKEPAVLIGLLITILTAVQEQAQNNELSWRVAGPIVFSLIIRFFVYSPESFNAALEAGPPAQ